MRLYASSSYIEQHGTPATPDDMQNHRLICQGASSTQVAAGAAMVQWLLGHGVTSRLNVNNYFGVLQCVINHLGIGVLPNYVVETAPEIVRVLPEVESAEVPVFLAYPEELRQSKRIAAFRDFVVEEIQASRRRSDDNGT